MLQKSNMLKIAEVFFREPTKQHYLVQISRITKIAHTSVKKYLKQLEKESIILRSIEKRGSREFPIFRANLNEKTYKQYKILSNLYSLQASGLIEYLVDNIIPKCIVLFGSYRFGEDIEVSDIDLFIETKDMSIDLSKFEKKLNRKIQLHFNKNFENYQEELKNNIINGILLYGYLRVFKRESYQKRYREIIGTYKNGNDYTRKVE